VVLEFLKPFVVDLFRIPVVFGEELRYFPTDVSSGTEASL
jgi:hypothetical protein